MGGVGVGFDNAAVEGESSRILVLRLGYVCAPAALTSRHKKPTQMEIFISVPHSCGTWKEAHHYPHCPQRGPCPRVLKTPRLTCQRFETRSGSAIVDLITEVAAIGSARCPSGPLAAATGHTGWNIHLQPGGWVPNPDQKLSISNQGFKREQKGENLIV